MGRGPRSKHGREKRGEHEKAYSAKRLEWTLIRETTFYDHERREAVAMINSPAINIERGEVLYDSRGFVAPALDPDSTWRLTLLKIQSLGAELNGDKCPT